jgi:hypothetical protein
MILLMPNLLLEILLPFKEKTMGKLKLVKVGTSNLVKSANKIEQI